MAGMIVGTGIVDRLNSVSVGRNKEYKQQQDVHNTMMTSKTDDADMYISLPGVSLSTLVMNLPQIVYSNGPVSPIAIDRYDWERLRGQIATQEDFKDDYQAQRLGLMFNQLYRQGAVRVVDYRDYYSRTVQRQNIEQTRSILSSQSEHDNRAAARTAANGFINYGLGGYQESLRDSLDNLDRYVDRREMVTNEKEKLDSGTGNPELWNERVVNQYMAALEVRRKLQQELGIDVKCIGQHESQAVVGLLDDVRSSEKPFTVRHTSEQLSDAMFEFDVEDTTKQREIADQISTIASEVVGSDNDNWFVFGPRLALLESGDAYSRTRSDLRFKSLDSVISESRDLLSKLQRSREDNKSVEFSKAEVEWVMEEHELTPADRRRITAQMKAETDVTNFTRDIDDYAQDYSPAAKTVVESILMDPMKQYSEDEIFREAVNLMRMLEPVRVNDAQLESFMHRGAYRRGDNEWDWYQDVDRQKITL